MKYSTKTILVLSVFVLFVNMAAMSNNKTPKYNKEIKQITEAFKHSQTYYFYGRSKGNSLYEFNISNYYIDEALKIIDSIEILDTTELEQVNKIKGSIIELDKTLDRITDVCIDNMNGRYPLFMSLTKRNSDFQYYDVAGEIGMEKAIEKLISIKIGSPRIKDLMEYAIIVTNETDLAYNEVAFQYMVNNTSYYVISSYELVEMLTPEEYNNYLNVNFTNAMLDKIAKKYNINKIAIFKLYKKDEVNRLFYWGGTFELWNAGTGIMDIMKYEESFCLDKSKEIIEGYIYAGLITLFFLIIIIVFSVLKREFYPIIFYTMSLLISLLVVSTFLYLFKGIAPPSVAYYKEPISYLWKFTNPFIFIIIPLIINYLIFSRFFKEKIHTFSGLTNFLFGTFISFPVILVSYLYLNFETISSLIPALISILFILALCVLISKYYISFFSGGSKSKISGITVILLFISLLTFVFFILEFLTLQSTIKAIAFSLIPLSAGIIFYYLYFYLKSHNKSEAKSIDELKVIDNKKDLVGYLSAPNYITPSNDILSVKSDQLFSSDHSKLNIVTIIATRGSGKTRVVDELSKYLKKNHKDNFEAYFGDCDEFQDSNTVPYEPFVQAFGEILGAGIFLDEGRFGKKLGQGISKSGVLDLTPLSGISELINNDNNDTGASVAEVTKAIIKALEDKVDKNKNIKILITIDDLQWMDDTTLELFKSFIKELSNRIKLFKNISLIFTIRSDNSNTKLLDLKDIKAVEFLTNKKEELNVNVEQLIKEKDLVSVSFFANFIKRSQEKISFDYLTEKRLKSYFANQGYTNPLHILQVLINMVENDILALSKRGLFMEKDTDLENIPAPSELSKIYKSRFEQLDSDLLRILESAAFVGENFEASILASIWKMDRLDLLRLLKKAEDLNIITDKNEFDDVYMFNSKSLMSELRKLNQKNITSKSKHPQLIKEYHVRIVDAIEKKTDGELESIDLNIICSIANRTYINKDILGNKAIVYCKIAADRCRIIGRLEEAIMYYKYCLELFIMQNKSKEDLIKVHLSLFICYLDKGEDEEIKQFLKQNDDDYKLESDTSYYHQFVLYKATYFLRRREFDKAKLEIKKLDNNKLTEVNKIRRDFLYYYTSDMKTDEGVSYVLEGLEDVVNSIIITSSSSLELKEQKGEILNTIGGIYTDRLKDNRALKFLDERLLLYLGETNPVPLDNEQRRDKCNMAVAKYHSLNIHDKKGMCFTLNYYGRLFNYKEKFTESDFFLKKARSINETLGDIVGTNRAIGTLGDNAYKKGDFAESIDYHILNYEEANLTNDIITQSFAIEGIAKASSKLIKIGENSFVKIQSKVMVIIASFIDSFTVKKINTPNNKLIIYNKDTLVKELEKLEDEDIRIFVSELKR